MKTLSLKNITKKSAIAATVIAGLSAGTAFADTFNAALTIVEPIALSQTTQMNLGAILATTSNTCTIAALGDLSGTGCFDDSATGTLAAISVDGTTGLQVDIALTAGASAASELSTSVPVDGSVNRLPSANSKVRSSVALIMKLATFFLK